MGVTGLWRLIEPTGKPVPVETLENKVLAVDISIWLHQMVKGYQDAKGAPLANAHLMGLFQRLCKLLYFRIKPIFVFDGGFPDLKKETISKRQDHKVKYNSESERIKRELALLLSKKTAINSLLGKQISPKKNVAQTENEDNIFKLPELPKKNQESESDSEEESSSGSSVDLHSMDLNSEHFKNMPLKEKYDLLVELKETRKMNSWGRLHELPKKSDSFSDFQMQRLLKRRKLQECFEETEKEMGVTGMSLKDLESLLNEEGIDTNVDTLPTKRIASNDNTRFLLINNIKQALAEAKQRNDAKDQASTSNRVEEINIEKEKSPVKDELECDLEMAIKMSMECVNETDTATYNSKTDDSWTSCLTDTDYSDSEDEYEVPDMSTAKAYIMQYSDFTNIAIEKLVSEKSNNKNKAHASKLDEILEEINREKALIESKLEISSEEDNKVQDIDLTSDCAETVPVQKDKEPAVEAFSVELKQNHKVEAADGVVEDSKEIGQLTVLNVSDKEQNIDIIERKEMPIKAIDSSQSSVICIHSSDEDILSFDVENTDKRNPEISKDSESDEDDFEDVPEINSNPKTVVQLILNTNTIPDKNDLFADIFENTEAVDVHVETEKVEQKGRNELKSDIRDQLKVVTDDTTKNEFRKESTEVVETNLQNETVNCIIQHENDEKATNSDKNLKLLQERTVVKEPISTEKLNTIVAEIQSKENSLIQEKGRLDRVGRNITEQMTKEAQELLQIFGIPYIVAPMEAEAQCAFLETINLTDGTITDDSDIWLFGGRTVYKNFFNQKKHVLQFLADRIEKSYNLSREQLVLLALLVGSDYTTGVSGVGPVTALEILASFPFNKKQLNESVKKSRYAEMVAGLQEFKVWVRAGRRTDNISLKKKLKNVNLSEDFPSVRVVQAYLEPNVEKSNEKFTWGELDITILRDYTKEKFGWSQNKLDEIIKPVLKRMQEKKLQRSVEDYFKKNVNLQSLEDQMSKRVKAAVQKMGPNILNTLEDLIPSTQVQATIAKKRKKIKNESNKSGPTQPKLKKNLEEKLLISQGVKVISETSEGRTKRIEIQIPKTDRVQEIIPQREKEKQSLLQNKLKAIEIFRKTKIDRKKKAFKKKVILPKNDAELSETDSE